MGTISEKLIYLAEAKRQIKNAIIARGQSVSDNDRFVDYASAILQIETGSDIYVSPLDVTSNGTFDAGSGNAYNPVTVNVSPNVTSKAIDENGTYNASDEGVDGFSTVTVDIEPNLVEKTITEEGEYSAEDDNVDGYSKIIVALEAPEYCTVRFMNRETLLQVVENVPYGGFAMYQGEEPTESGKVFTGWNPSCVNIVRNTTCYATFEDEPAQSDEEIQDTWEDIIACRGANYPIGAYKTLLIGRVGNLQCKGVVMYKVAINERGTVSTWLAANSLGYDEPLGLYLYNTNLEYTTDNPRTDIDGWKGSDLREWLNNDLLAVLPNGLSGAIAPVTKYSRGIDLNSDMIVNNIETQDRIWIPSTLEYSGKSADTETMGIHYDVARNDATQMARTAYRTVYVRNSDSVVMKSSNLWLHMYKANAVINGDTVSERPNTSYPVIIGFCL